MGLFVLDKLLGRLVKQVQFDVFMGGSNPDYYIGQLNYVPYDWGDFVFNKLVLK